MRGLRFVATGFLLVLALAGAAHALEMRTGQTITIEKGVTIDDDLLVAGQQVKIDGDVRGNLLVASQRISIGGKVGGSVVAFGQTIECTGPVAGSFHAAGQTVTLDSTIQRNFMAAGQAVTLGNTASILRDAFAAGDTVETSGVIGGDLKAAGRAATIAGGVGQTAQLWIERLHLTNKAFVAGDLVYVSPTRAQVDKGAKVLGQIRHRLPPPPPRHRESPWLWRIIRLVWLLLFTALLAGLLPRHMYDAGEKIRRAPLWSLFVGFLAIIVTPFVAVVLLVPLLPAAIMVAAIWLAFLYVAKVTVGVFLGSWIFRTVARSEVVRPVLAGMLGVVIIWALGLIPYFAGLVAVVVALFGYGALAMMVGRSIAAGHRPAEPAAGAPPAQPIV